MTQAAALSRGSGVLLHPTSLPAADGIGDLGRAAFDFIDFLARAHQKYWQVLPLGPTGDSHSPYASSSSFAGNPLLIDLQLMAADTGLDLLATRSAAGRDPARVDYDVVRNAKLPLLRQVASRFEQSASPARRNEFQEFCDRNADWLDDYALFRAVQRHFDRVAAHQGVADPVWSTFWDADIARREASALRRWRDDCRDEITLQKVLQFYFDRQWTELKQYAAANAIQIIGDIPIFVAFDSADVWASPEMFLLDEELEPIVVAGVPPDYFSATGQRWGNPLYDWDAMQRDNFGWWMRRFESMRRMVDVVRIDHFRGFEACWSIPVDCPTAVDGEWVPSPGRELFQEFHRRFTDYPILAEDLGLITPEVDALRVECGFPGMRVLQFAFDPFEPETNHFLPHHYEPHTVVYTGTHDNDTTRGWFESQTETTQAVVREYLGHSSGDIAWDLIRLALASVAELAIFPMQDLLSLGSEARMNVPSTMTGNWSWRLKPNQLPPSVAERAATLATLYGRA